VGLFPRRKKDRKLPRAAVYMKYNSEGRKENREYKKKKDRTLAERCRISTKVSA
jgi:hypothetical protein